MVEAGVLAENEKIELVEGEIVVMAAKGYAHERIKNALVEALFKAKSADIEIGVEMTLQFAPRILFEPDIVAIPKPKMRKSEANFVTVEPGGCLLLIEIAVTSVRFDRGRKASLYAKVGVQEYWVVDANERLTWIYTGASDTGWASIIKREFADMLTTPALPAFQIKLDDIE
jgi:Uma2 family endonuclease